MRRTVKRQRSRISGMLLLGLLLVILVMGCEGQVTSQIEQGQSEDQTNTESPAVKEETEATDEEPVEQEEPVVEERDSLQIHLSRVGTLERETAILPPIFDYRKVELADGQQRLAFYTDLAHQLTIMNPTDLKYETLPYLLSVQPDAAASHLGNFMEMVADRWEEGRYYTVLHTSELHLYNYESGQSELVYESERPIYNLAVSPDRQHIALLISQETIPYSVADLVVVDTAGEVVYEQERAATLHHSDGFWMFYPLQWLDQVTVRAASFASEEERFKQDILRDDMLYRDIRIDEGSSRLIEVPQVLLNEEESVLELTGEGVKLPITDDLIAKLKPQHEGDGVGYARSPEGGYVMFMVNAQLYIYEMENGELEWVGDGHFVQWNDEQHFIWLQGYTPFVT